MHTFYKQSIIHLMSFLDGLSNVIHTAGPFGGQNTDSGTVLPSSSKIKTRASSQKQKTVTVLWQLQGREDCTHAGVFKDDLVDKWLLD